MWLPADPPALIEAVRITDPLGQYRADDLTGDLVALWEDDSAPTLIRALPPGDLHRCFVPGWGIRAHGTDGPLYQVAFCYDCHGARLWGPAVPADRAGIHGFDAGSAPARELLGRFRSSAGGL
ncbi:hypothetical protein GTW40_20255 [Streptomyces sp. SID4985]|uniref:hypothetical protein n=1 Tax=Streptomyces sp. SID4985 TaxID=2690292 RepID=UPI00136FA481|nr:hypothetical protein [Streptomyces sp. SID4985]MYQ47353.1 hypothetical protein [Streptomyces sp. SID4985]